MTTHDESRPKNAYKQTLNLPNTAFPMKANLGQNEPESLKRWHKQNLYFRLVEKNKGNKPFTLHDGPPYANGSIHVGHLLNKVLKDCVVRSQLLLGKDTQFIPGWDCHGLPIEHKVMTELLAKQQDKLNGLEENKRRMIIRSECKKYVEKFMALQSQQMQRLLTLGDYDNPYLTMAPEFEEKVLEVFADMVKEGIVYRQLKPVHWSIENQTALAEAELEYYDREDSSVYVYFESENKDTIYKVFNQTPHPETPRFLIWTTTPWTLPANLSITVHNDYTYALVQIETLVAIVAKERIGNIEKTLGKTITILGETQGKNLVGQLYRHSFCDRSGKITAADYVTLEDGTGLVHTAPGHGVEDYQTGLREGLDIYCPVTANGTYDDTVPEWLIGKHIWKANALVIEHLQNSGHLALHQRFMHSYPHDWRSKTPVIFRSTEQWFVGVDKPLVSTQKSLRELALTAIESQIEFIPDWGKNRLKGMMDSRPDWCLSRQRAWGLPIPAFRMTDGSIFLTENSVRAVAKIMGEKGSDIWFTLSPSEILSYYDPKTDIKAPQNLDIPTLEKMYDIFDVWFESGSSWNAVLRKRGLGFPADLYLEGSDQHRGWFHLSLLASLGATQMAPFKRVLTHGFIVDKDGRKMSKSVGNTINVEDLLKTHGAEITRWWVSSLAFENDIKVDISYFDKAGESYRKVRNTLKFLLSTLSDFKIPEYSEATLSHLTTTVSPLSIDGFVLGQCAQLITNVSEAFEGCKFKTAHSLLYDFCNDTLSAVYCTAVKDRLYCDTPNSPARRQTQAVTWAITETLLRLLSPFLPHTTDEAYQSLTQNPEACIHLQPLIPFSFTEDTGWATVFDCRNVSLKALEDVKSKGIENNLDAGLIVPDPQSILEKFSADLPDLFGVSRVTLRQNAIGIIVEDLRAEPRCERSWKRDTTVKQRSDGGWLSDRDAEAVGLN